VSDNAADLTGLVKDLAKNFGGSAEDRLPEVWSQITKLGLVTIGIDEDLGGSGGELGDLVVVIRELARAGLNTPMVECSTAAYVLGGPSRPDAVDTVVVVDDSSASDLGLVPFARPGGRVVVIGPTDVRVANLSADAAKIDATTDIAGMPAGHVRLMATQTELCSTPRDAVVERLALARATALLGCAFGAYDLTRTHTIQREQFGAPLITLPAVSSALAQMTVQLEQARAALDHAVALAADTEASAVRRGAAVATARIVCASTATAVARGAHQLHGALGVTLEYPLHRYSTALWAWRDADMSELAWSQRFGAAARTSGEDVLWDELTV
jgi:acyl-CoA dehydrogenase